MFHKWGFLGVLPLAFVSCIAQKSVGVTFTESGKGVGLQSGQADKTATAAPGTVASTVDSIGAAVVLLEFTVKENGAKDGYPLQIKELRFTHTGTADIADLRFVLEGPGSNNTISTANGNTVTFKDFGDIIVSDGDTVGKTYQVKMHIRANIQGSLTDNSTVLLKTSPLTDFDVTEASSNFLPTVSSFQQSAASTITITGTELQGKTSFTSLSATAGVDFPGTQSIYATDRNGRVDLDFTEDITLSAHNGICPNSAAGTLASTDPLGLTHAAVQGVATWTNLTYTIVETIRIRAVSTSLNTSGQWLCSAAVSIN